MVITSKNNLEMARFKILDLPKGFYAFEDLGNEDALYAYDENTAILLRQISHPYVNKVDHIPDDITIPVYPVFLHHNQDQFNDVYSIIDGEPIQFRVNQIKWITIQYLPRP